MRDTSSSVCGRKTGTGSAAGFGDSCFRRTTKSSMPSAMLEHEAHMFGFRDAAFALSGIGSPQQMQILGCIIPNDGVRSSLEAGTNTPVPSPRPIRHNNLVPSCSPSRTYPSKLFAKGNLNFRLLLKCRRGTEAPDFPQGWQSQEWTPGAKDTKGD